MITLTETAQQKVVEFIEGENKQGLALRLSARRRGPRKFEYELNLEEAQDQRPDDLVQDFEGFKLWMDPASAENVDGATMDFEQRGFESGFKFENPQSRWEDPVAQAVQDVLDKEVNPSIASHGGMVDLVEVDHGTAILSFGGGCQGCGMVDVTLKQGIEVAIVNAVPEVTAVRDVTDHAAGTNPYYQAQGESPF